MSAENKAYIKNWLKHYIKQGDQMQNAFPLMQGFEKVPFCQYGVYKGLMYTT